MSFLRVQGAKQPCLHGYLASVAFSEAKAERVMVKNKKSNWRKNMMNNTALRANNKKVTRTITCKNEEHENFY